MPYNIFLKRSTEKELECLPESLHDRIVKALLSLKENPRPFGTKKLQGQEGYRLRVGDYRVLYSVDDRQKKIEVYAIGNRREVYRG